MRYRFCKGFLVCILLITLVVFFLYFFGFLRLSYTSYPGSEEVGLGNEASLGGDNCQLPAKGEYVVGLEKAVKRNDEACFLYILDGLHETYESELEAASVWLREFLLIDKINGFFYKTYLRLAILNIIVPVELFQGERRFVERDRQYILSILPDLSPRNKSVALVILGYYKNDDDIEIFKGAIVGATEDVLVSSIIALVHNCSEQAQKAINIVFQYKEVQNFLRVYRTKETLSKFIQTECPVFDEEQ